MDAKNTFTKGQKFEISFINQLSADETRLPPCTIDLIWSDSEDSAYTKCGFAFHAHSNDEVKALIEHAVENDNKLMRCILRELADVTVE